MTGFDQNGNPQYAMNEAYNPEQQALYNFMVGSKNQAGGLGNSLWGSIASSGQYDQPFDPTNDVNAGVNTRMGQMRQYMDPFLTKQRQDRDNEMRNQGLTPTHEAYGEEMNRVEDQQQQSIQKLLADFQPEAFRQAYQQHEQPLNEAMGLTKFGAADPLSFSQTSNYGQNAADATGAFGNYDRQRMAAWEQEQKQRSGMLQGIGAIGGAMLGGPMGSALGSGLAGMFGGSSQGYGNSWTPMVTQYK